MSTRNKNLPLTEKEQKFVLYFAGNAREAARKAGYKHPETSGWRVLARPDVQKAIAKKLEKKNDEVAKLEARAEVMPGLITRTEIIEKLGGIVRSPDNQRTACMAANILSEIFGMKLKLNVDPLSLFAGWTPEERRRFDVSGILPDALRSGVPPQEDLGLRGTPGVPEGR